MTDDIIKSCGCFATEACDHYERPGVLKHCPSCAAKDAELKAYKANSFCTFCAGKEDELKEQTRKSDVIIAAKDAAMWRKDREIDSLRAHIADVEGMAKIIASDVCGDTGCSDDYWRRIPPGVQVDWLDTARALSAWLKEG